ncbi:hypothetical protein MGH68_17185 [Erysipelothrix sp. D19-032]
MQEAKTVLAAYRNGTYESKQTQDAEKKRKGLATKHTKYFTDFVCLMIAVCFAWIVKFLLGNSCQVLTIQFGHCYLEQS